MARITTYLDGLRTMKAHFLQVAPSGAITQGTVWLDRPGRMRFQYDPPSPLLLVAGHGLVVFHDICPHPYNPEVGVRKFWLELSGDRDEIVTDPATWGGIGVLHVGAPADGGYVGSPQLGSITEMMAR